MTEDCNTNNNRRIKMYRDEVKMTQEQLIALIRKGNACDAIRCISDDCKFYNPLHTSESHCILGKHVFLRAGICRYYCKGELKDRDFKGKEYFSFLEDIVGWPNESTGKYLKEVEKEKDE